MIEKEIDAQDLFKKPSGAGPADETGPASAGTPTEAEMREAASPELSPDEFIIAGRTVRYRISNIRTQKMMAIALDAITDLLKTIDLAPVLKGVQDRMNRPRKKILERIADMKKAGNENIMIHTDVRQ